MAYNTPKTNWNASDIPNPDDFNRIEGNAEDNHERLDGIEDGTTKVPNAEKADNADKIKGQLIGQERFQIQDGLHVLGFKYGDSNSISFPCGTKEEIKRVKLIVPSNKKIVIKQVRVMIGYFTRLNINFSLSDSNGYNTTNSFGEDNKPNFELYSTASEAAGELIFSIENIDNRDGSTSLVYSGSWWVDFALEDI